MELDTFHNPGGHVILHKLSMDWFKGKFTGNPYIYWENPWFPVDFPLNQSIETCKVLVRMMILTQLNHVFFEFIYIPIMSDRFPIHCCEIHAVSGSGIQMHSDISRLRQNRLSHFRI